MSDGGVILRKSLDEGIKLTEKVSAHFEDQRDDGRARHEYLDLFRQRVCGIALGYADCNDAERTRSDPCLKMACDRSPLDSDDGLGSQHLRHKPENVYKIYRGRGDAENRIEEMQEIHSDRTSCTRFLANQLRLIMSATACVLFQELRWRRRRKEVGRSQVGRLRLMLLKIGAHVVESVRRIVLHFPTSHPWTDHWIFAARMVDAEFT